MTQEEKWRKNYKEVAEYMDTYHRNKGGSIQATAGKE